jgi:formylglycine-generating enzyme required for sulfatase activity
MRRNMRVIVGLVATLGLSISPAQQTDDFRITSVRLADNGETVALRFSAEGGERTLDVPTAGLGGTHFFRVTAENRETGTTYRAETSPSLRAEIWTDAEVTGDRTSFALIPEGSFSMGDAFGEGFSAELPVHSVVVSAFYMEKYEVTKALWDEVRGWGSTNGYTDLRVGLGKAANHPVHTISWYDIVKWCNARSEKDGLVPSYMVGGATYRTGASAPDCNWSASGYRLPSEAEWEKAARGGLGGKRFSWGDRIDHSQANYRANGSAYSYDISISTSPTYHPDYDDGGPPYSSLVGSFAPNGYGLYDMSGSMWEWCWDWWGGSNYPSSTVTDPHGPASGAFRVLRGGSWSTFARSCRAAHRLDYSPISAYYSIGFRVARSSVP